MVCRIVLIGDYNNVIQQNCEADVTAPIIGATSLEKLKALIGLYCETIKATCLTPHFTDAVHFSLSEDEMKYLEEPYCPRSVMGHV
jgi:hypothetical protein